MPTSARRPSQERSQGNKEARISAAERARRAFVDQRARETWVSFGSALIDDDESPPLDFGYPVEIVLMKPRVIEVPTGDDLTIDVIVNGGVARTLTVLDGEEYSEDANVLPLAAGLYATFKVTNAAGAERLGITIHYRLMS